MSAINARRGALQSCHERGGIRCDIIAVVEGSCMAFASSADGEIYTDPADANGIDTGKPNGNGAIAVCRANGKAKCYWQMTICDHGPRQEAQTAPAQATTRPTLDQNSPDSRRPVNVGARVALVIGNSVYANVPRLTNPDNDARLMAETLRSLGFTLVGGGAQLDLNEDGFRRAVKNFGSQLQGADVGLFYYAGHGLQVRGENYLVPIDASPTKEADVDFQLVDANLVLRQMEGAGTKLNLVILDACRNNPFGGRGLRAARGGLAQMQSPEGTLISFATQPGSIAQDGTNGHSPYTEALVQTMRKPGLDIFRIFNDVGLAVASETAGAQQPWFSSSPIKGDFYFVGEPATSP